MSVENSLKEAIFPVLRRTDALVNSQTQSNRSYRGMHLTINVSNYTSGNYTPKIQGMDVTSGNFYDILVGAAISAAGLTVLKVYPGITAAANLSVSDILPRTWRITLTGAATPNMELSVDAHMVL